MFTGIIRQMGRVHSISQQGNNHRLLVQTNDAVSEAKTGDSIAVDGVCLTLVSIDAEKTLLGFDLGHETREITACAGLSPSKRVHIEQAMRLGDKIDGHLLSGHVAATGVVTSVESVENSLQMTISAPRDILQKCFHKGSIAVDGVSLTIHKLDNDGFSLDLIPATLELTHLGKKSVGDIVNIETDFLVQNKPAGHLGDDPIFLDLDIPDADRVEKAIYYLRNGIPLLLVDPKTRENESDLILAAEKTHSQNMNFLIRHGSGIVCLTMPNADRERLKLPFMVEQNENAFQTAFTVSIEAKKGITTGVSAHDRAKTIQVACDPESSSEDIASPGHMFPLCAKDGGVFTRKGHTEGSVDLAKIAGLRPMGVLCELVNDDGTMAKWADTLRFAKIHGLMVLSIDDIVAYRTKKGI